MARSKKPPPRAQLQQEPDQPEMTPEMMARMAPSMKRGGPVKRTGTYQLHKGERVVPAKKGKR